MKGRGGCCFLQNNREKLETRTTYRIEPNCYVSTDDATDIGGGGTAGARLGGVGYVGRTGIRGTDDEGQGPIPFLTSMAGLNELTIRIRGSTGGEVITGNLFLTPCRL